MEDVVLHYKSGPDQDLSALIETTERLLAPFPCRPPQVFSPWFPSVVDRHLPLRPARPPPRILSAPEPSGPTENLNHTSEETRETTGPVQGPNQTPPSQDLNQTRPTENLNTTTEETWEKTGLSQNSNQTGPTEDPNKTGLTEELNQSGPWGSPDLVLGSGDNNPAGLTQRPENSEVDEHETSRTEFPDPEQDWGVLFVPETPPDPSVHRPGLQVRTRPGSTPDSPSKRSWAVFRHRVQTKDRTRDQTRVQASVQTSSRRFLQTVSKLGLHPRQRVKWVIDETNCRDVEQVWRSLSRPLLPSLPPSCNAHIVRDRAQIWVYCDLRRSEEVALVLKEELSLRGTLGLWERSHGHIYSL